MVKKYADRYWVTLTIDRHSKNVKRIFDNKEQETKFYKKYPKGGKLEKIVIGCADSVEGGYIYANFEYYVPKYESLVVRKSGAYSNPRIDGRKYKVTRLTRAQAEKKFPSLFARPNKDMLELAIKHELNRIDPYVANPETLPHYESLPPQFVAKAKKFVKGEKKMNLSR